MSVIGEERKKKILEILDVEGTVKVNKLAELFDVSTETIRRYLDELDKEEKLKKVYGGAIKVSFHQDEPSSIEREIIHASEKLSIGLAASNLIQDYEVIAIDDGSTPLQMVKHLKNKKNLTIITCSIPALHLLMEYHASGQFTGKIICLGGEVNVNHQRISGQPAEQMLENVFVDKSFLSADGVSWERGVTAFDQSKASLTKKLIEHSTLSILLVDSSKIGINKHYKIKDLPDFDMIISNDAPPKEWERSLEAHQIEWIVAEQEE